MGTGEEVLSYFLIWIFGVRMNLFISNRELGNFFLNFFNQEFGYHANAVFVLTSQFSEPQKY
jgi:hypothetical protein